MTETKETKKEVFKPAPEMEKAVVDNKPIKATLTVGLEVVVDDSNIARYPQVIVTGDLPNKGDEVAYDVGDNLILTGTVFSSEKTNSSVVLINSRQTLKGK